MQSLKQGIGFVGASLLVLNGLIGAGIFALPQKLYDLLGSTSPLIFPVLGLVMLTIVQCFSQLASRIDGTGGPVLYTKVAFGKFLSFQTGWLFYLARATAIAANAHVLLLYLDIKAWGITVDDGLIVVSICLFLTFINVRGIFIAMRLLDSLTALKLVPVIGFVAFGATQADLSVSYSMPNDTQGLTTAVLIALYAFIGFETVVVTGSETKNAKSTIPNALVYTVVAIAILYTVIQLVYVGVVSGTSIDRPPLVAFADILAGEIGAKVMALAAVFSVAANILANMISTSRLSFSMAENKEIPKWFGQVHDKYATPHHSAWFLGVVACLLSLSGGFVWLAIVSVLSRMTVYLLCVASLIKIKHRDQSNSQSLLNHVTPYLSICIIVFVISQTSVNAWWLLLSQMVAGVIVYRLLNKAED